MKFIGRLLTFSLLLANLAFLGALSLHVVHGSSGTAVIAKTHLTLVDTCVDTTKWTAADITEHAALVSRISQAGRADLLPKLASASAAHTGPTVSHDPHVPAAQKTSVTDEPHQKTIFDFDDKK